MKEPKPFTKSGRPSRTYLCEANGLKELASAGVIDVARVISVGDTYITTEYIEHGIEKPDFFVDFGKKMALLHRCTSPSFGFYEDNFIGATPQLNIPDADEKGDWLTFYFRKRLLFQYQLAEKNGYVTPEMASAFARLENKLEDILKGSEEPPCLLHGDLWSGNFLCNSSGNPVLIDPAVYYGHREADLAMTRLFGGFPEIFYEAYQQEYPLPEGWRYREDVYKLYHVLNHLNLFGAGYLHQAIRILQKYTIHPA